MKQISTFEEYKAEYKRSVEQPEQFWSEVAEDFEWKKKWNTVLDGNFEQVNIKWFDGAELNITENCLDRNLKEKATKPPSSGNPTTRTKNSEHLLTKNFMQKFVASPTH